MLRNRLTIFFLAVTLVCGAAIAATPEEQAMADAMAAMADEPAMTQADVDTFIKMAPQVEKVMNDQNAVLKLYQDNGISPQRFGVISSKIAFGMMMTQGVTREQFLASGQVPEFLMPSDAEVALVEKNMEALAEAVQ